MLGFGRKKTVKSLGRGISENALRDYVADKARASSREFCLDVGAGETKEAEYMSLDINPAFKTDFVGDIRTVLAVDCGSERCEEWNLDKLRENYYSVIRLQHIVEHIEWIYQEELFKWVYQALAPDGLIYVATPNLEYAAGVYLENRKKQKSGKPVKYPIDEHVYFKPGVLEDMQRWVNFKLFSGCSPGDYHHSAFDRFWLCSLMIRVGFKAISVHDGATLLAVGMKPGENSNVTDAIKRVVS